MAIPNSVTSIGNGVFASCTSLVSASIPNSVTSISAYTFSGCSGLISVTIPENITSIGDRAFEACESLTAVTIPNTVKTIGEEAFMDCNSITSLTIGSGVTAMGSFAFDLYSRHPELVTITSLIEEPMDTYAFSYRIYSLYPSATLYVPQGTLEKYKACEGWKRFYNIIEGIPSDISSASTKKGNLEERSRYDLSGKQLSQPQRGLNIVKMSDGTTKKVVVE